MGVPGTTGASYVASGVELHVMRKAVISNPPTLVRRILRGVTMTKTRFPTLIPFVFVILVLFPGCDGSDTASTTSSQSQSPGPNAPASSVSAEDRGWDVYHYLVGGSYPMRTIMVELHQPKHGRALIVAHIRAQKEITQTELINRFGRPDSIAAEARREFQDAELGSFYGIGSQYSTFILGSLLVYGHTKLMLREDYPRPWIWLEFETAVSNAQQAAEMVDRLVMSPSGDLWDRCKAQR